MQAINSIFQIFQVQEKDVDYHLLLTLVAFTDTRDTWTSSPVQAAAARILADHANKMQTEEFIIHYILKDFIRPLFSKLGPATVTTHGRKVIHTVAANTHHHNEMDPSLKPWKFQEISATRIFGWVVDHSNAGISGLTLLKRLC